VKRGTLVVIASALAILLGGCVHTHQLLPETAVTAGALTHTEAGEGVLWIEYGGKA
jgi:hypothetical protein